MGFLQGPPTGPVVRRTYKSQSDYEKDAREMLRRGYLPQAESVNQGKVDVGKTLRNAALTGGIGLILGGRAHKGDTFTITWIKG